MYYIDLSDFDSGKLEKIESRKIWEKTILLFAMFTFQNCRLNAAGRSGSRMTVALLGSRDIQALPSFGDKNLDGKAPDTSPAHPYPYKHRNISNR